MSASKIDSELLERQITYLVEFMKRLDTIIPPDKQHLYHLVFGDKIFGSYTSLGELIKADQEKFQNIALARYYPLNHLATIIQTAWRRHVQSESPNPPLPNPALQEIRVSLPR